jgi:hypothetical protein
MKKRPVQDQPKVMPSWNAGRYYLQKKKQKA